MRVKRPGLSSVYGFIVLFTLLMAGIGAALTILDAQASVWEAQDRARQVQASQQTERLALSLNHTSLTVRNVGLIPSELFYLYQKGAVSSTDSRIGEALQEGSAVTLPVAQGMLSFAIITSLGNVFWVYNSTEISSQLSTVPVTFDASGLDPSYASASILNVDGLSYNYSSMPKTFAWTPGSRHNYSYAQGFATGEGQRVGWSYARGLSSAMTGTVTASQPGIIVSTYLQQYLLRATGGDAVHYIGSPSNDGWYNAGSTAQVSTSYVWNLVAGQSRQSLFGYSVDGASPTSVTRASSGAYTTQGITMAAPHALALTPVTQYYLTVRGGNGFAYSVASQTGDNWFDSGSTATATTNYVWSVVAGQSRLNLLSWNLDGGANAAATRAGSGTFTATSIAMDTFHTVNFNSVTQYYVTTVNSVSSSPVGVSIPGSYFYYSSGGNCGGGTSSSTTWSGTASASGTTVTYSYSVGVSWPNDSCSQYSQQYWTASSWRGSFSSTTCTYASLSGSQMTSYTPENCTIISTSSGSYSSSAIGQTSDGWFDSGVAGSITASISGAFSFSSWGGAPSGITIASPSSASTTIIATTYGTITATFSA